MLTATQVRALMGLDDDDLTQAIRRAGYKKDTLVDSEFVGLTNGGEFAYHAHYMEHGETVNCHVFAKIDTETGRVLASY